VISKKVEARNLARVVPTGRSGSYENTAFVELGGIEPPSISR